MSCAAAESSSPFDQNGLERMKRCCCCYFSASDNSVKARIGNILPVIHKSLTWKIITICASIFMVFFESIVKIIPYNNNFDPLADTIGILIFLIVIVDVLLKAIFDPEYFLWYCSCCRKTACGSRKTFCNNSTSSASNDYGGRGGRNCDSFCSMGSFFFWMDIAALLFFALGLSFHYYSGNYDVNIKYPLLNDKLMIPTEGERDSWYHFMQTVFLVGRLTILARIFQASTVVVYFKLKNKIRHQVARLSPYAPTNIRNSGVLSSNNQEIRKLSDFTASDNNSIFSSAAAAKIQRKWRVSRTTATSSAGGIRALSIHEEPPTSSKINRRSLQKSTLLEIAESSRVGAAMRELTAKHVAALMIMILLTTIIFTFDIVPTETIERTMVTLHNQTQGNSSFASIALDVARRTTVPFMYQYFFVNGTNITFPTNYDINKLLPNDFLTETVSSPSGSTTGVFIIREFNVNRSVYWIAIASFVIFVWLWGVIGLVSLVTTLVVVPIGRMIRLLTMLTKDPLGYQKTDNYKNFVAEEDDLAKASWWEKEVLEGMETSFLQKTMLQIGSLMNVGFGSAGVDIIRQYLLKGSSTGRLALHQSGSTVNCIFLFCDIRQFTDATEALQEEIFVFTNKIAYVVHSICHAYDGFVNKNIGDAFLVAWKLPDDPPMDDDAQAILSVSDQKMAEAHADKALYSMIQIAVALRNNSYFLETIGAVAKSKLLEKLGDEKGQVVRLGFGLHSGKAVQGAIGSQRKIDATYISEAVERSETLESLTKRYGLTNLMSDAFYNILSPHVRRRCRRIDRVKLGSNVEYDFCVDETTEIMSLYTFDINVDALSQENNRELYVKQKNTSGTERGSKRRSLLFSSSKSDGLSNIIDRLESQVLSQSARTLSFRPVSVTGDSSNIPSTMGQNGDTVPLSNELQLAPYSTDVWMSKEMRLMRQSYTDGIFFSTFASGLDSFFVGDWKDSKAKFSSILERSKDGPSRYFLSIIDANNGSPYPGFKGYGDV